MYWYSKCLRLPKSYLIRRAIDSLLSRLEKDEFRVFLSTFPEDEPLPDEVEVIEKCEKDLKEGKVRFYTLEKVKKRLNKK